MGIALFTVMIVVPILEITVFILVGRYIGLWPTLACIVLTALIGTMIIRFQGSGLIAAARKSIEAGEAPVGEVLQGVALLAAGALLITPGFITDTLGFLLLIPGLRRWLAAGLVAQAMRRAELRVHPAGARPGAGRRTKKTDVIIEGEWQEVEPDVSEPPRPGRGWGRGEAAAADDAPDLPPGGRAGG